MASFSIRKATSSDIPELERLWRERVDVYLKYDPQTPSADTSLEAWHQAISTWLAHPNAHILVADRDKTLIGYIIGWIWDNPPLLQPAQYGLITELSVDGHCKQGGVGTALLAALKDDFQKVGLTRVEVRVSRQHPIEQAFWSAVGAKPYANLLIYNLEA